MIEIGDRFTVSAPQDACDANGNLLARFLPGLEYTATSHSVLIVRTMEAAGNLVPVGASSTNLNLISPPATLRGSVKTKGSA